MQEEIPNSSPNYMINQANMINDFSLSSRAGGFDEIPRPPAINRRESHYTYMLSN